MKAGRPAWVVGALVVLVAVAETAGCTSYDARPPAAAAPAPKTATGARAAAAPVPPPEVRRVRLPAAAVLHAWDRRRARAWAAADPHALAALYVPGSAAGRVDVALLRSYRSRGVRVVGLRMQVLSVRVLSRTPRRWRLRITDRLAGAVAVGAGRRLRLPRGAAATRLITLARAGRERWRVADVRPAPR